MSTFVTAEAVTLLDPDYHKAGAQRYRAVCALDGTPLLLVLEAEHQGKQVKTEVRSGFTDMQRLELWGARQHLLDEAPTAEIRYQELTLAQGSDTWSLRFPTFLHWRADK